jgi:hypothetical protein
MTGQRGPMTGVGPRPTTLSGAAAEMDGQPVKKNRVPLFAALGAVVVLGGVGAFIATRPKTDNKPEIAIVAPPVEKPKDENVKLLVTSDPPGARVFRADTAAYETGVTPLTIVVKKGFPPFDVQVKLDGYKSGVKQLIADRDTSVMVSLEKLAAEVVPVADNTPKADKAPDVKPDKHHHSSSSSSSSKTTGEKVEKKSGGKGGKEEGGGDDMKLLQPKF